MTRRLAVVSSHPIQYQVPLFRELARRDIELSVLFCSSHGTAPSFDPGFGATVQFDIPLLDGYPFEFLPNVSPRPHIGTTGLVNPTLALRVMTGRYDAVVLHGYNSITNALAYSAPRSRRRTRLLLRGDSNAAQVRPLATRLAKQVAIRAIFRRFDHFLTAGTMNARYYADFGVSADRMTLAPFSVDNDFFRERSRVAREAPALVRGALGLPTDRPLFLYVGKLQRHKRPVDLLHAFAEARQSGPATLAYVGEGEQRSELERLIRALGVERDVRLLGFRNQTELPPLYGAADAFVLPSESEPWGLVVNEAMASGLAVAVSREVGAAADLVNGNGGVFAAGDVGALAGILRTWIHKPEVLARHKSRSCEHIDRWGIEQTADGFLRGVERAIAG